MDRKIVGTIIGACLIVLYLGSSALSQSQALEPTLATPYPSVTDVPNTKGFVAEAGASRWSTGGSIGMLGSTPDGAAFTMNGSGEYFVDEHVSIGPLLQLGLTGDMALIGLSGQGKYYIDIPDTQGRGRMVLQSGVGFAHADFRQDDTSWLIPLGVGYEYALSSGVDLTATGLVNFTNLSTGGGSGADVMPGFAFGVRF